jgi:hypothetical protein
MKTKKVNFFIGIVLLSAALVASCAKDDPAVPIDKAKLKTSIASANTLLTTTFEGVAAGNYIRGSQAALKTAVDLATVVDSDAAATQVIVNNATAALDAAIATYGTKIVTAIDPANLVGHWTFDQITTVTVNTVVKDYSGNGRDGAIKVGHPFFGSGTIALAADRYGVAGKALKFDKGSNVEIPYNAALNPTTMSLSLWARADVNNPIVNNQYMISMNRWNGYKLNFQDSPKAFMTVKANDPGNVTNPTPIYDRDNDTPIIPQGQWWHIVVTFGGGNMTFYLNGVEVKKWTNTPGTAFSLAANPVNLVFGQDLPTSVYVTSPDSNPFYVNWGGFFIGVLDEIRMYKSVLTAAQVTSIYTTEKP